jgi:hypothetical protein
MVYAIMQRGARCERFSKFAKCLPGRSFNRARARYSRYLFRCASGRNDRVSSYQNPLRNDYSLQPLDVTRILGRFLRDRPSTRIDPGISRQVPPFGHRTARGITLNAREGGRVGDGERTIAFRKSYESSRSRDSTRRDFEMIVNGRRALVSIRKARVYSRQGCR